MTPLPLLRIPGDRHQEEVMHHRMQRGNSHPGRPGTFGQRMQTGLRTWGAHGSGTRL